jgi:gas vesicle protein
VNSLTKQCVGLTAAFAVGVLSAPRSGEKTRALIHDRTKAGVRLARRRGFELLRNLSRLQRKAARIVAMEAKPMKSALAAGKRAFQLAVG